MQCCCRYYSHFCFNLIATSISGNFPSFLLTLTIDIVCVCTTDRQCVMAANFHIRRCRAFCLRCNFFSLFFLFILSARCLLSLHFTMCRTNVCSLVCTFLCLLQPPTLTPFPLLFLASENMQSRARKAAPPN